MRFARTDLIARVKAEILRRTQAADKANAAKWDEHRQAEAKYVAQTGEAWKKLADTIRLRARQGRPITSADIPKDLCDRASNDGGWVRTFRRGEPSKVVANTAALENLLLLLEAATDEEITTASLERVGFRVAGLFRE